MSAYTLSAQAHACLDDIYTYIGDRNLDAADRLADTFIEAFERLANMPQMGRTRPEWTDQPVRFWPVEKYWVIYDPAGTPLTILAVYHQARDVKTLLVQP